MNESRLRHFQISIMLLIVIMSGAIALAQPGPLSGFPITLNGDHVRYGSTALGDVNGDGVADIVVGATDGKVHAYTGSGIKLWEYDTGAMGIEGKAAIADIDGDTHAEVVIGAGSPSHAGTAHGGLYVISHLGALQCQYFTDDTTNDGFREGVYGSPTVADIETGDGGRLEIAFAGWDRTARVINHDCSLVWEKYIWDTSWSSAAVGDLDQDGDLDVVVGAPIASDIAGYEDGGLMHAFDGPTGAWLPGFPIQVDETIQSSPALGDIDGDGWLDIVVGTGRCWADPACAPGGDVHPGVGEYISAWDHNGAALPGWPVEVDGTYVFSSPALADLDGNGVLDVIINTVDPDDVEAGQVYALNGNGTAQPGWPLRPTVPKGASGAVKHNSTRAAPIVADVNGDSLLEVVLPCSWELVVWTRNGTQITRDQFPPAGGQWSLDATFSIASSPGVGDVDGDGDLDLVVGGGTTAPDGPPGAIWAWDLSAPASSQRPWPMFRRSEENDAVVSLGLVFSDSFESGNTSAWDATVP